MAQALTATTVEGDWQAVTSDAQVGGRPSVEERLGRGG